MAKLNKLFNRNTFSTNSKTTHCSVLKRLFVLFLVMANGHNQYFRSAIPKNNKASKRWGSWGGHGGWGGHGSYSEHHGFSAPYGHPITHPGFSTIGFPGHAVATADVKNKIAQKRGRAKRQLIPAQYVAPALAPVASMGALHASPYNPVMHAPPPAVTVPFLYPAAAPAALPLAPARELMV